MPSNEVVLTTRRGEEGGGWGRGWARRGPWGPPSRLSHLAGGGGGGTRGLAASACPSSCGRPTAVAPWRPALNPLGGWVAAVAGVGGAGGGEGVGTGAAAGRVGADEPRPPHDGYGGRGSARRGRRRLPQRVARRCRTHPLLGCASGHVGARAAAGSVLRGMGAMAICPCSTAHHRVGGGGILPPSVAPGSATDRRHLGGSLRTFLPCGPGSGPKLSLLGSSRCSAWQRRRWRRRRRTTAPWGERKAA